MQYDTVKFHNDLAVSAKKTESGFEIATKSADTFRAKKLIFATGVKDIMPEIKGFSQCWGISVIHCPYCHGYEFKKQKTGIMANGGRAFHIASLVNNLTDKITILTSGKADFNAEQGAKLHKHNITIVETKVSEIEHDNGYIKNVVFNDGTRMDFDAVYAAIPFVQHSDIPVSMGCELTEQGHIKTDMFQKTTVSGVFACGDNASMLRSVAYATSTGNIAGAMANHSITEEEF